MRNHDLLRQYRKRKGMTCRELAKRLGVAESTLRSLENGTRTITPETAKDIESATAGELTRPMLRSDIFGAPSASRSNTSARQ